MVRFMSFREEVLNLRLKEVVKNSGNYVFPEFLRAVRKSLGFTRASVAEMLCISETRIHNIEAGKTKRPDVDLILTISHFYGLNPKFIEKRYNEYMKKRNTKEK